MFTLSFWLGPGNTFPNFKFRSAQPRSTSVRRIFERFLLPPIVQDPTEMNAAAIHPMQQTHHYTAQADAQTHPVVVGYLFWLLGFVGAHRFYFGKPITGTIWFFTGGLFLVGWIVDLFFIPSMAEEANQRYRPGHIDYTVAWCLQLFLGIFGIHRLYMGKIFTGILFMLTGGLLGIGYIYDTLTLNEQVEECNAAPFYRALIDIGRHGV
jgi:TM2 domain-containing membrane protein YozV